MRRRRRRPAPGLARSQARCYTLRVVSSASRTAVTIIRLPNRSPGEKTCRMISAVSAGGATATRHTSAVPVVLYLASGIALMTARK